MDLRFKYAINILLVIIFAGFQNTFAQCPDGSDISSNDHCFVVHWMEVPEPLPPEIKHEGVTYIYQSGVGTVTDPAVYQSGGGGGACNAQQDPFTGTIIIDGMECEYMDGEFVDPLPIELIEFKAVLINREVRLEWTTAQEVENKGFDVQKSANGSTWSSLVWIDGAGYSNNTVEYSVVDNLPYAGANYYRLRQNDVDGDLITPQLSQSL